MKIPDEVANYLAEVRDPQLGQLIHDAAPILDEDETPFFPAYTDHGSKHVRRVLKTAWRLIPATALPYVEPIDVAVLAAGAILHDLGMHIHEEGFLALVAAASPFTPRPWFRDSQSGRAADRPWKDEWDDFRKEAQYFTKSQTDVIFGPGYAGAPAVAYGDTDWRAWGEADKLLVGEFLRRHHARLSHEIAFGGFPGTDAADFAPLHGGFADLAGVTARSHNEDLRTMLRYLDWKHSDRVAPAGTRIAYVMALLRIADFLQLDSDRAPAVLLRLRNPQSRVSIQEWSNHRAITALNWLPPDAVRVQVDQEHGYRTHFQLQEVFRDLQAEFDTTTAVLSELYGGGPLAPLRLEKRRVETNLDDPNFHAQLTFVPQRAALRNADDLFRFVIRDLYGPRPAIAGRELVQNAVDAVRARRRWQADGGGERQFRDLAADIVVELAAVDEGFELRVSDRGIGMTAETIVEYFLKAGASQASSPNGASIRWMKAGRFGVGLFAAFLLGDEIRVTTRHVDADEGIAFSATLDDDLIELQRVADAPFGTEIVIPCREGDPEKLLAEIAHFYRLRDPEVIYTGRGASVVAREGSLGGRTPTPDGTLPPEWRRVDAKAFDAVLWRLPVSTATVPGVVHNGLLIEPEPSTPVSFEWNDRRMRDTVAFPPVAVFDPRHRLELTLTRYDLVDRLAPFEAELLTAIGIDLVAFALAGHREQHPLGQEWGLVPVFGEHDWVPLLPIIPQSLTAGRLCVLWRLPGQSVPEAQFLGRLASCDWDALPARAVVVTPRMNMGHLDDDVSQLAKRLGNTLGSRSHVSYVGPHVLHGADSGTELLAAIAEELGGGVMLTLFDPPRRQVALRVDHLSETWHRLTGGRVARDPVALVRQRDAIVERHPELVPLLTAWRQLRSR